MKEIYHCTPNQLDGVDSYILDIHWDFLMSERKHEQKEQKRQEQKISRKTL